MAANHGHEITPPASNQVVHQDETSGRIPHLPQQGDRVGFIEMMQEERACQNVIVRRKNIVNRIEYEESHVSLVGSRLLLSITNRLWVDVAPLDFQIQPCPACSTVQLDRSIAPARGEVEHTNRST